MKKTFSFNGVPLSKVCKQCQGTGFVPNIEFQINMEHSNTLRMNFEMQGHQYPEIDKLVEKECGPLPEPEQFVCDECEGEGTLITDDGSELIEFIRQFIR